MDSVESVFCPRTNRSRSLEVCRACARFVALERESTHGRAHLRCHAGEHARVPGSATPPVGAVMSPTAVCVRAELPVTALATLLLAGEAGALPVVDAAGFPVGVVSRVDLIGATRAPRGAAAPPAVADLMTPTAFTVAEDAPLSEAAAIMACEQVGRLPVVSAEGQVVGVVSALDLARWIAELDGCAPAGAGLIARSSRNSCGSSRG